MAEVMAAIEAFDLGQPWAEVAPSVLPVLPRRRAMPPGTDDRIRRQYPPGIAVGFGADIGPAFMHVTDTLIAQWGVTADELAARAVANVRERAQSRRHFGVIAESIGDVPTMAFQSREGWASTLLLMPDQFERCFGAEPRMVLAPMRDLLVALPIDTDRDLAAWILDEFCAVDPNALDVPMLAFADGAFGFLGPVSLPGRNRR